MRSTRARGDLSFRSGRNHEAVDALIKLAAKKTQTTLHKFANVGNHLHLLIECKDKRHYRAFIRLLSGRLVQIVTKARKGSAIGKGFFDHIPFSRIVSLGRDFEAVAKYIVKNAFEGAGLLKRSKSRKDPEIVWIRSYIPSETFDDSPELQAELGFA